jgi:thioredoxin type arsenate reductase
VTLVVNWVVKPFSMALLAWLFFRLVFAGFIGRAEADQYIAGCIILAAAPCTAMVFVWSHLTDGDPAYTLVQVSVNDLIMLVAFVPIVQFLVTGASSLTVPFRVLLYSVIVFIVIPLTAGTVLRSWLIRAADCRPDHLAGVLQRFAGVRIDETLEGGAFGGGARRADRREQLLRAGGGDGHCAVRAGIGRGARHGCRGAGGSSGDAVGLRGVQPDAALVFVPGGASMTKKKVLILCTGNSARSQMAEGLLRHEAGDRFEVFSAGTHPTAVRPEAVAAMSELGIDISHHWSKPVDEFAGREFDFVITVCDHVRESCPVFPGKTQRLHWPFSDPASVKGSYEERKAAFRAARDQIHERIREFLGNQ